MVMMPSSSAVAVLCGTLPSGETDKDEAPVLVLHSDTAARAVDAAANLADSVEHRCGVGEDRLVYLFDGSVGIDDIEQIASGRHLVSLMLQAE
jgi:hypothetical protein